MWKSLAGFGLVAGFAITSGCASAPKAADVQRPIQEAIKQAGYKDVSVSQDRDKGVVTLSGSVSSESDKMQAVTIAKAFAVGQVVGNEIAVLPVGDEKMAKAVNSDLDGGIKKNLDAALLQARMQETVKYDVNMGVVTLTGEINSPAGRMEAQRIAAAVPNVKQVVNKLDVKNQKATSDHQ
jgi:hyperosmotically inducible periplasmic protein